MLRDLANVPYIPLLSVRPAEMQALQTLPERDKGLMLPLFRLRPWLSAKTLESALLRISEAYGDRPYYVALCEPEVVETRREVHDELDLLRTSSNGFGAWCTFIENEGRDNLIPSLQLSDVREFDRQTIRLHELGRGLIVPIERPAFSVIRQIAMRTATATNGGRDVVFVLDFGRQTRTLLLQQAESVGYVRTILEVAPEARVCLSASSFPDSFTAISEQDIFERQLFQGVRAAIGERIIYSDRGSARAERQTGGGGAPAPRIDYAQRTQWRFFRADDVDSRTEAYQRQARRLVESTEIWDPDLRLWGTQMIERTAMGDGAAITSPARSTAARINIHLHQQLFYGDERGRYATDEEWVD